VKRASLAITLGLLAITIAIGLTTAGLRADDDQDRAKHFHFVPNSVVVTRSVYVGTADTVTIGETLPPGCAGGPNGTTTVAVPTTTGGVVDVQVPCGVASDNGEAPNLSDSHNVWNNSGSDSSFGISSPIFLDNITKEGHLVGTLPVPSDQIVTSFSSKSELALNLSVDGKSLTFIGYRGGPGCPVITYVNGIGIQGNTPGPISPTRPNLIDASASSTPGICDPTNSVISSFVSDPVVPTAYYRAVAEVDADGHITITPGNAYSGDNGRAAKKGGNGLYYTAGNDNSGNLSKGQLNTTPIGIALVNATGAELRTPNTAPTVPPDIQMIGRLLFGTDKPGKDTNFRGLTIFDNTLYVSKGSGGNGINTVYQVGTPGTLPTGDAASLAGVPITILPGFPNTAASTSPGPAGAFPFGMFFANSSTLYVCDEGDGTYVTPPVPGDVNTNVEDSTSLATAGVQKWVLQNGTWVRIYVLQDGLNLGFPYSVPNYPASLNPATGGCRNMTARVDDDGTVTIWAITSTLSANGDQGADPNKLVKVSDLLSATTLPTGEGLGHFETIRSARAGEVLRGVAFAPSDH
jgi:hypothetical protein